MTEHRLLALHATGCGLQYDINAGALLVRHPDGSHTQVTGSGSHTHTLSDVTDAGGAAALDVGTAAGTVAAGDHSHPGSGFEFPIGWLLLSLVNINPVSFLGYGTWENVGAGRVLVGLDSGDADFDTANETGGAKTVVAAGSCSTPTFTGSALGTHSHGVGTYATSAHSGAAVNDHAAHTHSVTSNVAVGDHTGLTHSGTAVADHASHTHTYTDVVNHVHVENINTATTGGAVGFPALADSSTSGSTATGLSTANPTGGVATGTTAGPSATLTHSVTQPSAHGTAGTVTHSVTNNAVTSGNPSATLTHSVTQPSDHSMSGSSEAVSAGIPAGTVSAPTFTGSATSVVQPYLVAYFWERTS